VNVWVTEPTIERSVFRDLDEQGRVRAARGNHGQSMGWAARKHGVPCTIVVPHGNSVEKNAAMRSLGATLIEHGDDGWNKAVIEENSSGFEHPVLLADLDEMASDTLDTDSVCALMDLSASTIADIDAALIKLDEGSYGVCELCGDRFTLTGDTSDGSGGWTRGIRNAAGGNACTA